MKTFLEAARVTVRLCGLPIWLRRYPLPCLFDRLTPAAEQQPLLIAAHLQHLVWRYSADRSERRDLLFLLTINT